MKDGFNIQGKVVSHMEENTEEKICSKCKVRADRIMRCQGQDCKYVYYSPICQLQADKVHRLICKKKK